jgi:YD repeat-containing protein
VAWSKPGGDFATSPDSVLPNITGPVGVREWSVLSMVQGWMRGEPYHGAVIKYVDDSQPAAPIYFSPTSATFSIAWVPQLGLHDPFSYLSFPIGERRQAMVNIAGGSVKLVETDVSLPGVAGMDAVVQRAYDSRGFNGSLGPNWEMWPQAREGLGVLPDGDVYWVGGQEHFLLFDGLPNGSYRSPQGYRGSLVKAADGKYRITMHDTGLKYNFDAGGYPESMVDQNGNTIAFYYQNDPASGQKLLKSMLDSKGRSTEFSHAGPQKVTEVKDPAGRRHLYGYNAEGRLISYTDPAGKTTTYEYLSVPAGAMPPISLITDPNGNKTKLGYALARDTQTLPAGIASWDFTYRLTSLTRVTDLAALTGPTWTFDYSVPWKTKVKSPNPKDINGTTYSYDKLGRVTEVVDPLGETVKAGYTPEGFVNSQTDQATETTTLQYSTDGRNNVTNVVSPMNVSQSVSYDPTHVFYPKTVTNAQSNSVTFDYWPSGNRKSATSQLPAQNQLSSENNPNGTIQKTTDGVGNQTFFDYYPNADLQGIRGPLGVGDESFEYDGLSRVIKATDAKGQAMIYTYDTMDRVTRIDFAGGSSIVNVYDNGGRLTRTDNKSGAGLLDPVETVTYGYDRLNRQTSKVVGGVTFSSDFDEVGNLKSLIGSGVTVTYEYNALNLLTDLIEPGGRTTFEYDGAYRRRKLKLPERDKPDNRLRQGRQGHQDHRQQGGQHDHLLPVQVRQSANRPAYRHGLRDDRQLGRDDVQVRPAGAADRGRYSGWSLQLQG